MDEFRLGKKIGGGSFGQVFLGAHPKIPEPVVIKTESNKSLPQLINEWNAYVQLGQQCNAENFWPQHTERLQQDQAEVYPTVLAHGEDNKKGERWMVMQQLGPSLDAVLAKSPSNKLGSEFVARVGVCIITALERLHGCGLVHRDLKPQNIATGVDSNNIYLFDLGLCTSYLNPSPYPDRKQSQCVPIPIFTPGFEAENCFSTMLDSNLCAQIPMPPRKIPNRDHVSYLSEQGLVGTIRFVSLGCHHGTFQTRRDDLESLGYVLLYLARGDLPWQGKKIPFNNAGRGATKVERQLRNHAIMLSKMQTRIETLVEPLAEPLKSCLLTYFTAVRALGYNAEPDYSYLRSLFKDIPILTRSNNESFSVKSVK
jgi:casein kinase 1